MESYPLPVSSNAHSHWGMAVLPNYRRPFALKTNIRKTTKISQMLKNSTSRNNWISRENNGEEFLKPKLIHFTETADIYLNRNTKHNSWKIFLKAGHLTKVYKSNV